MARNRRNVRGNRIAIKDNVKYLIIVLICIIAVAAVTLVIRANHATKLAQAKEQARQEQIAMILNEEPEDEETDVVKTRRSKVNMTILGNVLCSDELNESAYNKADGTYDFYSMFKNVEEYTQKADISIVSMETNFFDNQYTGGRKYNSPKELAQALKNMGVSVANLATNHSFNYGVEGVVNTKNYLTEIGIDAAGIKTPDTTSNILKEVNGIKIAFLSYTYGLNDEKEITDEHRSYINITDRDKIKQDMESMRAEGADFICVTMHWQTSKNFEVTEEQASMADFLVENGADIILGTHPSQVEKMEVRKNAQDKNVFIAYSVGNYISTQSNLGMILEVQLTKETTGEEVAVKLAKVKYTPIYTYENNNKYELLDIRETVRKYENEDSKIVDKKTYNNLKKALEEIEKRIGRE